MTKQGLFITFEGVDGSGKTTQVDLICKYLDDNNIDYLRTRDPGGTPVGKIIRDIVLNYEGKIVPFCELFLYLADRAQHVDEVIVPALNEGRIVLCDRYIDSTIAYQGYARGLNIDEIIDLNNIVTHSLMPDLTLLFDVDIETTKSRMGNNQDRLESEAIHFHEKVRNGYLELAKKDSNRIKVIDSGRSIDEISKDAIEIIRQYITG